jgi:pyruvate ferredoxin oxidoreductase alpha subunit
MPKARIAGITGNEAMAEAMRQIAPDVVAAYPITPSTQVVENFSQFVADGRVPTNLVAVESEHSAMSACIGAAAAGGRVMTATSSAGLAYMWEMLYVASGLRLPIVMACVNRALSAPLNIHGDHSDSMGARDSGWVQLYGENAQEAYDNALMAFGIAEDAAVRLPVMCCYDGFTISHAIERVELLPDEAAKKFVGVYKPLHPMLDVKHPVTYGAVDLQDYYTEHKRQQAEGMAAAREAIRREAERFAKLTGRSYGSFATHRLEDAEIGILSLGSSAGTMREVIDELRDEGIRAGGIKLRVFRPFPAAELAAALGHLKLVAVLDRADSFGAFGGPVFHEVRSALYDAPQRPRVVNFIYGLGGRDLTLEEGRQLVRRLKTAADTGRVDSHYDYLQVRE